MKKEYKNPAIEVIKLQAMNQILAGSPQLGDEYDPSTDGEPIAREYGYSDDF